ncbi:hypothetical protein FOXYS1_12230 [Fusarium oxysporum]|uniref:Peptidase S1 domain-containing protein n=1 Tax=Fusarium oxysporum TaxID=5507 RepID=A0A8H5A452_FUSOX|nr:hypothetical protein FOXYS1_12230 [Fusarium oxysporum]
MSLQEPSDRERRMYYHGLPSRPRLVARSSTVPWSQPREWPERKKLDVATGHKIQQLWNDPQGSLRQLMIGTLSGVCWTAIDILRVGYESAYENTDRSSECPVTMLISVPQDSTSFRQAEAAIIACKDILIQFGLDDIQVEMKESIVTIAATSPVTSNPTAEHVARRLRPGPFTNDFGDLKYKTIRDMSEYVGTSIGASQAPPGKEKDGTKCVYLHGNNGKTYALTCRHVLFLDDDCEEYRYPGRHNSVAKDVIQPGKNTRRRVLDSFTSRKNGLDMSVDLTAKPSYDNPAFKAARPSFLLKQTVMQSCEAPIGELKKEGSVVLGRVEFSPPMELCSQGLKLRDWALVELSQDSFTTNLGQLRNKVPVTRKLQDMLTDILGPMTKSGRSLDFDDSLEVAIGPHIIPESDVEDATPRNLRGDKGLVVMKHGLKTGFTIGLANGIHSVIRHASGVAGDVISSEWCIIGIDAKAFSDTGDSGACVFDLEGRIGGMITAGLEASHSPLGEHDVTYATPMQWLLDDIKQQGYSVKLPN